MQRTQYYPSGLPWAEGEGTGVQNKKYNGKEWIEMHGLDVTDLGNRSLYHAINRFTCIDRFAEKYPWQSPYAFAANNPVNNIDVNGDSIWFTYQYDKNKQLSGVTMHVTGKVINISSNSKIDMTKTTKRIANQLSNSFQGSSNNVSFNTDVNLSVANSMEDVNSSDHIFALTDGFPDNKVNGAANEAGGKVAFINVDYFSGLWDTQIGNMGPRTAGHEFGHLAGLEHSNGFYDLMKQGQGTIFGSWATSVTTEQLKTINFKFNKGYLNSGENSEYVRKFVNGKLTWVKMPNRGMYLNYIKY